MRWCHRFARHHFHLTDTPAHSQEEYAALLARIEASDTTHSGLADGPPPITWNRAPHTSDRLVCEWTLWLRQTNSGLCRAMRRWMDETRVRRLPPSLTNQTDTRMSLGIATDVRRRALWMTPPSSDPLYPPPAGLLPPSMHTDENHLP